MFSFILLFKNIYIVQKMYRKQQNDLRLMFAITLGPFVNIFDYDRPVRPALRERLPYC